MRSALVLIAFAAATLAAPRFDHEARDLLSGLLPTIEHHDDKFTYYDMPTPLSGPCDLTTGPDGALWVQDILTNKIARLDPDTGKIEEFTIPYQDAIPANFTLVDLEPQQLALACAIQPGHDGNLYAAAGIRSQFLKINPTTKEIKVFTPPPPASALANLENFNDLYAAPDGMYFTLTTANVLFHFDYATEKFTPHIVPTPLAGPLGTYYASDGNIWIVEFLANKVAKFDLKTKKFTEYPLPLNDFGPAVLRAESPKGRIWFTGLLGQSMGSIDIYTGDIQVVQDDIMVPPGAPTEDTVDSEGRVWFSTLARPTLNYLDPKTHKLTHIQQPTLNPLALTIAVHYTPGNNIWFTETANNRIGKYSLD